MLVVLTPTKTKRILSVTFILILISAIVVFILGNTTKRISKENKESNAFLSTSDNVRQNFEDSLKMYTGSTQKELNKLVALRPTTQEQFIQYLSQVENIGPKLGLKLNMQSIAQDVSTKVDPKKKTLDYKVTFNGTQRDLESFLSELEALPYYIAVSDVKFKTPELALSGKEPIENVLVVLKLYIK